MSSRISLQQEWLEADGLGGYASGTAVGIRTRRYHALLLTATTPPTHAEHLPAGEAPSDMLSRFRRLKQVRRRKFPSRLHAAADTYIVQRRSARTAAGRTIIAGYPWFADGGRDTFISWRGLCLAAGRLETARDILLAWAASLSAGMLPNRFPDQGERPEFNSVDIDRGAAARALPALRKRDPGRRQECTFGVNSSHGTGTRDSAGTGQYAVR